jgi:hypothetical protein
MYAGDYNNLLNVPCDYGIEILVNPEPTEDKGNCFCNGISLSYCR